VERETLAGEVGRISARVIRNQPERDKLIFDLYFSHDLSPSQIAECKGIGLSKRGVEQVLGRLTSRVRRAAAGPDVAGY